MESGVPQHARYSVTKAEVDVVPAEASFVRLYKPSSWHICGSTATMIKAVLHWQRPLTKQQEVWPHLLMPKAVHTRQQCETRLSFVGKGKSDRGQVFLPQSSLLSQLLDVSNCVQGDIL